MPELRDKFVDFDVYCPKCKHFIKDGCEMPCDECLEHPTNEYSHKPVYFEEKEK